MGKYFKSEENWFQEEATKSQGVGVTDRSPSNNWK